ncbi:hypothetical protein FXO38_18569 [Capsicum annuum]|nr:hypothetical protein FXO38_18569 [Capsicum annuum]
MEILDELFKRIDDLTDVIKELTSKWGVIPSKKVRESYTPTVEYVDEILSLMGARNLAYDETYDLDGRIMDLNVYNNFKPRYDVISTKEATPGGLDLEMLISQFKWDEDVINYVRRKRPFPCDMSWIGAKKILTAMNLEQQIF